MPVFTRSAALLCSATVGLAVVLNRKQKVAMTKQDEWAIQCTEELHGLVSPYYVPKENGSTKVACLPAVCDSKLGRSDDVAAGTAAPCTWDGMEDTCCTDKIETPCKAGQVPCLLGEVSSLGNYTDVAVMEANKTDVVAIKDDCGKLSDNFDTDSSAAIASGGGNSTMM